MTNGEKIKEIFPDGVLTSISNSYYWGDDILVHKSWWNAEYKETTKNDATDINVGKIEPTPKNNLGVDAVRRKAVLNTLDNMDSALDEDDRTVETYKELLKECYKVLPPATPIIPKGHWIANAPQYDMLNPQYICSECGNAHTRITPYCEMCGAKMVEPQESEE